MTRRPFDPGELDAPDAELGSVADALERYTKLTAGEVPPHIDDRVMAALADEPPPRRSALAALLAPLSWRPKGGMARTFMVAATMALAILAVVAAGELASLIRNEQVGPSPVPAVSESPSATPSASPTGSPTPSATASPSPSPTPTAQPTPTPRPSVVETPDATSQPTQHETPEASDDHSETSRPSDDGNSGSGGGSGDDSS